MSQESLKALENRLEEVRNSKGAGRLTYLGQKIAEYKTAIHDAKTHAKSALACLGTSLFGVAYYNWFVPSFFPNSLFANFPDNPYLDAAFVGVYVVPTLALTVFGIDNGRNAIKNYVKSKESRRELELQPEIGKDNFQCNLDYVTELYNQTVRNI